MEKKNKPSGVAIFMYFVIGFSALIATLSFVLYYTNTIFNSTLLWVGIVFFMIMYHLWVRIIFGNITKLFKVNYKQSFFKEKAFEKHIYKLLKVKKWKKKTLTYNPELYSVKNRTMEDIANTTVKSELDHWVNVILSILSILFALIWGELWIFILSGVLAAIFDSQFIIIQRYNRPRLLKIIKKQNKVSA